MIKINQNTLQQFSGLVSSVSFECDFFGMSNSSNPKTISFIDNEKFINQLNSNDNISVAITTKQLEPKIRNKVVIVCEDPRYSFFQFCNKIGEANYIKKPSIISTNANIHPRAYVCEYNVVIGDNSYIGPNATILADVEIGDNCIINAGATLGCSGYEFKRTSKGILTVFHDGKLIIGSNVRIGANSAIDKGFSYRNTIIDDDVKIDDLVYIAHGSQIGEGTFLVGHVMVSGSTTIGKNVWVGPGSILSSGINIGDGAYISIGSVVNRDVMSFEHMTGNFAIKHSIFIKHLKNISSENFDS